MSVLIVTMMLVMMMLVAASTAPNEKDCRFLFIFWSTSCGEVKRETETTEQTPPLREPSTKPEPDIPKTDPTPEGTGIYR
jgi:hypothetical protein